MESFLSVGNFMTLTTIVPQEALMVECSWLRYHRFQKRGWETNIVSVAFLVEEEDLEQVPWQLKLTHSPKLHYYTLSTSLESKAQTDATERRMI